MFKNKAAILLLTLSLTQNLAGADTNRPYHVILTPEQGEHHQISDDIEKLFHGTPDDRTYQTVNGVVRAGLYLSAAALVIYCMYRYVPPITRSLARRVQGAQDQRNARELDRVVRRSAVGDLYAALPREGQAFLAQVGAQGGRQIDIAINPNGASRAVENYANAQSLQEVAIISADVAANAISGPPHNERGQPIARPWNSNPTISWLFEFGALVLGAGIVNTVVVQPIHNALVSPMILYFFPPQLRKSTEAHRAVEIMQNTANTTCLDLGAESALPLEDTWITATKPSPTEISAGIYLHGRRLEPMAIADMIDQSKSGRFFLIRDFRCKMQSGRTVSVNELLENIENAT